MSPSNPLGLQGIEFTEFCGMDEAQFDRLAWAFGFSKLRRRPSSKITLHQQNDIKFLFNGEDNGFAAGFASQHGPSISSMGWRVEDAEAAHAEALRRGATPAPDNRDLPYPAIMGIGGSLIYLIDAYAGPRALWETDFVALDQPLRQPDKGFLTIDHLTNNVPKGQLEHWADFYKTVFGFTEVRHFDIEGSKTGLMSFALRSPDGSFCIPINEPKSDKDQIAEYLRDYNGSGVQHLAFLTRDILASMDRLEGSAIDTLDIDADYYNEIFVQHPEVKEDHDRIRHHQVLVDGDEKGYLLQLFTKNLVGPIFVEIIQRVNNLGFGEGNFGALFRTIEKDQERRGVI